MFDSHLSTSIALLFQKGRLNSHKSDSKNALSGFIFYREIVFDI